MVQLLPDVLLITFVTLAMTCAMEVCCAAGDSEAVRLGYTTGSGSLSGMVSGLVRLYGNVMFSIGSHSAG